MLVCLLLPLNVLVAGIALLKRSSRWNPSCTSLAPGNIFSSRLNILGSSTYTTSGSCKASTATSSQETVE